MPAIKHTVKCRKCGHVYSTEICDMADSKSVLDDCITKMGIMAFQGKHCPSCFVAVKMGSPDDVTIEIDVEPV